MKKWYCILVMGLCCVALSYAQVEFKTIASNRIIQQHFSQDKLQKIADADPNRLQAIWNYFSSSFTFEDTENENVDLIRLMNIYHFDVHNYEYYRLQSEEGVFTFRESIQIKLISTSDLQQLIAPYTINQLLQELPARPFPLWTSNTFTKEDLEEYKARVWDWARDFPEAYLQITSDTNRKHVSFSDLKSLPEVRRASILEEENYIIID